MGTRRVSNSRSRPRKVKVEKCDLCRKPQLKCKCRDVPHTDVKTPKVKDTEQIVVDGWCPACGSRVINGLCMNVTCSTRKT